MLQSHQSLLDTEHSNLHGPIRWPRWGNEHHRPWRCDHCMWSKVGSRSPALWSLGSWWWFCSTGVVCFRSTARISTRPLNSLNSYITCLQPCAQSIWLSTSWGRGGRTAQQCIQSNQCQWHQPYPCGIPGVEPPTVVTSASLLNALAQDSQWELALAITRQAKDCGLSSSTVKRSWLYIIVILRPLSMHVWKKMPTLHPSCIFLTFCAFHVSSHWINSSDQNKTCTRSGVFICTCIYRYVCIC